MILTFKEEDITHIFLDQYETAPGKTFAPEPYKPYYFHGRGEKDISPDYPMVFVPKSDAQKCNDCAFHLLFKSWCPFLHCSKTETRGPVIAYNLQWDVSAVGDEYFPVDAHHNRVDLDVPDAPIETDGKTEQNRAVTEVDIDAYGYKEFKPQENTPYRFKGTDMPDFPIVFVKDESNDWTCTDCAMYKYDCMNVSCSRTDGSFRAERLDANDETAENDASIDANNETDANDETAESDAPINTNDESDDESDDEPKDDDAAFSSERWTSENGITYLYPATQNRIDYFELCWEQYLNELKTNTSKKILINSYNKLEKRAKESPVDFEQVTNLAAELLRRRGEELPPEPEKKKRTRKRKTEEPVETFPQEPAPTAKESEPAPTTKTNEDERRERWEHALRELERALRKADELEIEAKKHAREAAKASRAIRDKILEMVAMGPERYQGAPLLELAEAAE